ncbi:MAG: cytochrome c3 family protein [Duodenibacillus sp.]|nr:cytochrome c3 family protein [Duodenibacillus sp.]
MKRSMIAALCAAAVCAAWAPGAQAAQTLKGMHKQMNLQCSMCHGNAKVREVPDEKACMTCHVSRKAVQDRTAKRKPNPHYGHDETVSCFECHKEHMESALLCDNCHKFEMKTP